MSTPVLAPSPADPPPDGLNTALGRVFGLTVVCGLPDPESIIMTYGKSGLVATVALANTADATRWARAVAAPPWTSRTHSGCWSHSTEGTHDGVLYRLRFATREPLTGAS